MKTPIPLLAASVVFLSACQDSQPPSGNAATATQPDPVEPVPTQTDPAVYTAAYRASMTDTDRDGIPDADDPNPNAAPERPQSSVPLAITSLVTTRADHTLPNWVIVDEPVTLSAEGLHHYGSPWWVRWHHADGILTKPVVPDSDGQIQLTAPEVMPHAVSLVAGHYVTESLQVRSQSANTPLLYPVSGILRAGETVHLTGEHLDRIETLWLGETPLTALGTTPGQLTLTLPAQPTDSRLSWQDVRGQHHETALPLVRPVQFQASSGLVDAAGWRLITRESPHSLASPVTLWLPAGETQVVRWSRTDRDHSALSLVLPDTTRVTVGAESTLAAWLWRFRTGQGNSRNLAFSSLIPQWTDQLAATEAALRRALNGEATAYDDAVQSFNSAAPAVVVSTEPLVIQPRWGIGGYLSDTLDAIVAGGSLYEPIIDVANIRAKPGSATHANIGIGIARDLTSCATLSNKPADLWPSDLCINNDSAVFASVRVVDWRSGEVLVDHVTSPLDANIVGGTGMGLLNLSTVSFLTGNGGALCKMRPCRIEVLTGGFGMNTSPNLSNREKQIADWLLARSVLDRLIFPLIESVTGLSGDPSTLTCFAEQLLEPDPTESVGYLITISDFSQKVAQSGSDDEIWSHVLETIVWAVLEKMQSMATDKDFAPCLANMAEASKNEVLSNVSSNLAEVASSAAAPVRFAKVVNTAYTQWEVLTNPRKIVFDATPRAAITEMTTSSGERRLYSDTPSDYLRLYGTQLVNQLDDGYYPDLVLTDRSGQTASMPITPAQVFDASDMSWVDLRIRVDALTPLIDQLGGSRFDVMLEMSHANYDEFPDDVLRLPAIHFDWIGDARLIGLGEGLIRAGDFGIIYGENLESYRRADLQLLFSNDQADMFQARDVYYKNDEAITFTLPESMPTGTYDVHLIAGEGNTLESASRVEVIAADASYVRILDNGANQDDRMFVSLLSATDEPLSVNGGQTLFVVPTQNTDSYDIWIGWEAGQLQNSSGESRDLDGISLECMDGNEDGVCTPRISGDVTMSNGNRVQFDAQDTLNEGEEVLAQ